MDIIRYFEDREGLGVLATSDEDGNVDIAVYARPHVVDNKTVVFIMNERLSHKNLKTNFKAAYLFREEGDGYSGVRLYLEKIKEESDTSLIESIRRRGRETGAPSTNDAQKYLVYFRVTRTRPLIGG